MTVTNGFNAEFDAIFAPAAKAARLGDAATFTQAGGSPVACTVLVDRGLTVQNADTGGITNDQTTITAYLADIGERPERGARFVVDGDTFVVDSVQSADESRVVCIVTTFPASG